MATSRATMMWQPCRLTHRQAAELPAPHLPWGISPQATRGCTQPPCQGHSPAHEEDLLQKVSLPATEADEEAASPWAP